jgi:hypothetical protein
VAKRIGRGQTFVSAVERGQHRVSVLEFLNFARGYRILPRCGSAEGRQGGQEVGTLE